MPTKNHRAAPTAQVVLEFYSVTAGGRTNQVMTFFSANAITWSACVTE